MENNRSFENILSDGSTCLDKTQTVVKQFTAIIFDNYVLRKTRNIHNS
jgi:hypothetical protein